MKLDGKLAWFVEFDELISPERDGGAFYALANSERGQTLFLTESGAHRILSEPAFKNLLGSVSSHLFGAEALEAAQWLPDAVVAHEQLKRTDNPERFHVYAVDKPDDVVVRIGGNCIEAYMQFEVMHWLHRRLENTPSTPAGYDVRAPEQYALLRTENGIGVGFMERVYGQPLYVPAQWPPTDSERFAALRHAAPIKEHLRYLLGESALRLLNDIGENGHMANVLVDRYRYNIIDQPHVGDGENTEKLQAALETLLGGTLSEYKNG